MTAPTHAVLIVGTGARGRSVQAALQAAGIGDIEMRDEVQRAVFDDDTDSWMLHTDDDGRPGPGSGGRAPCADHPLDTEPVRAQRLSW